MGLEPEEMEQVLLVGGLVLPIVWLVTGGGLAATIGAGVLSRDFLPNSDTASSGVAAGRRGVCVASHGE